MQTGSKLRVRETASLHMDANLALKVVRWRALLIEMGKDLRRNANTISFMKIVPMRNRFPVT